MQFCSHSSVYGPTTLGVACVDSYVIAQRPLCAYFSLRLDTENSFKVNHVHYVEASSLLVVSVLQLLGPWHYCPCVAAGNEERRPGRPEAQP